VGIYVKRQGGQTYLRILIYVKRQGGQTYLRILIYVKRQGGQTYLRILISNPSNFQTEFGTRTVSYSVSTGSSFPGGKAAGAWS
jgi:hypothetical protein